MEHDWITDRRPTEADGDEAGDVLVRTRPHRESRVYIHWSLVGAGTPWKHAAGWKPAVPAPEPVDAKPALAVGQRWRRGDGEVVTIDKIDRDHIWGNSHPFWANGRSYTPEGATHAHGTFGHSCDLIELISEADPQPKPASTTPRKFVMLTRTAHEFGHTIDAIDEDGVAWWMVLGTDEGPSVSWTQLEPLPAREVPADA